MIEITWCSLKPAVCPRLLLKGQLLCHDNEACFGVHSAGTMTEARHRAGCAGVCCDDNLVALQSQLRCTCTHRVRCIITVRWEQKRRNLGKQALRYGSIHPRRAVASEVDPQMHLPAIAQSAPAAQLSCPALALILYGRRRSCLSLELTSLSAGVERRPSPASCSLLFVKVSLFSSHANDCPRVNASKRAQETRFAAGASFTYQPRATGSRCDLPNPARPPAAFCI